jgi:ribonuclease HI
MSSADVVAYNTAMPWIKHRLRDADVWAKVDDHGALVTDRDGRVEVVYKPVPGAKTYRAGARNLSVVAGEPPIEIEVGEPAPAKPAVIVDKTAAPMPAPAGAIQVWTDGACTGNPGPAGLGVVLVDGTQVKEISEFLGDGTNNIAELMAIMRGLEAVTDRSRDVYVYTDSEYSIGVLSKAWKAKKNVELIAELRDLVRAFPRIHFVKVAGHAGIPLNERTDELAREAIVRRR